MFTTERLRLRAYEGSDIPILLNLFNNSLVQRTLLSEHIVPRGPLFAAKIEEVANESLLYVVLEAIDRGGEIIGAASLALTSPKNRDATLGIGLVPDVWNKGYGAEATRFLVDYAFKNLGMHRVSLSVLESNKGGVALYRKMQVLP